MTVRAACANSAFLTATTWAAIDATSYLNSETGVTTVTTSFVESSAFTPGAITIDGLAIKVGARTGTTGTISVRLAQAGSLVVGTDVVINMSDLPSCTATSGTTGPVSTAEGGWLFFKFAAPVLLVVATAYTLSVKTSSASQVNLWRDGTAANWSRYLRTTTTGAMAAGDDCIITGEWTAAATKTDRTVTMDETATTDYGSNTTSQVTPAMAICKGGFLVYGVAASTNYNLRLSGYCVVYNGGTFTMGASGTETPRNSTAKVQFDCLANGDFGLVIRNLGIANMYGLSRTAGNNTVMCKLAANAAASATSLTTDINTGWLNGDSVALAPTGNTSSQFEKKSLTADAVTTTLTISALTNAHNGTSPTQGELGLITRNNVFTEVNTSFPTFMYVGNTAIVNLSFTQFTNVGTNQNALKRGVVVDTTSGTFNCDRCSFNDSTDIGVTLNGSVTTTPPIITNCVFYNPAIGIYHPNLDSGTWTIDNCMFTGTNISNTSMIWFNDAGGTFTNNSVSGTNSHASQGAVFLNDGTSVANGSSWVAFTGNNIHSNANYGMMTNPNSTNSTKGAITNCNVWRNGNGIQIGGPQLGSTPITFTGCNFFGNGTNLVMNFSGGLNLVIDNCTAGGDTTVGTTSNISFGQTCAGNVTIYNSQFSVVTGIKVAASRDFEFNTIVVIPLISADKSTFNGTALFNDSTWQSFPQGLIMTSQNHGGVANDNRAFWGNSTSAWGVVQSDSGTVHGTDPLSEKLTPGSATVKLRTAMKYVPCLSGETRTFGIWVQKSATYNGNAPRLILLRQDSMGITADTVCATLSVGVSTWELLSYVTPAAPQDGVFVFVVDCDGTVGSAFVGDASVT